MKQRPLSPTGAALAARFAPKSQQADVAAALQAPPSPVPVTPDAAAAVTQPPAPPEDKDRS